MCTRPTDWISWLWRSGRLTDSIFTPSKSRRARGDLKHELENPDKHNVFFPHIDTFSLIAPEGIINIAVLPPKWGVYAVKEDASIKCLRKPIPLHDDADYDKKMDRGFACSLLRKAIECSVDRKLFYADNKKAIEEAKIRLQDELTQGGRIMSKYDYEAYLWMRPLCHRLGYYSQPDESEFRDRQNEYERCQGILRNTKRLFSALDDMSHEVKALKENLKKELENREDKHMRVIKEKAPDGVNTITTIVDNQGNIVSQSVTLLAGQRRYTGPSDPSNVISDEVVPDNGNFGSYGWVKPDGETVTIEKSESIGIGN